ncbi:alpha-amylase family protein [Paenibacillus anseongense]|uniref:alpha-amylase family protein n=1 Tax=Paenibacillus anseongense TaxID=2682845 RepID=UPI002DC058D4|nr:alpha-amylase family protein [Paenibacillus anseongense]MEC0267381.1 beta-galactosidase [Paenibacillus anseongense]
MGDCVIFYDAAFPYEGTRPDSRSLEALAQLGRIVGAEELSEALLQGTADNFLHLHGRYFPKTAWEAVMSHVRRGKGLLHLGSAPFRVPVYPSNEGWTVEAEQTGYHQLLQIHEVLPIDLAPIARYAAHSDLPLLAGKEALFQVQPTVGLALHVTRADDHPGQVGSSGPMDAHLLPLLKGISPEGREVAAPIVLLENTKGDFAGGRWIFANLVTDDAFWTQGGAEVLRDLAAFTARGVTEIWFKPNYACYDPGDRAALTIQLQTLANREAAVSANTAWTFHVQVKKDGVSEPLWSTSVQMEASRELTYKKMNVPVDLEPGYYSAVCTAVADTGETRIYQQGFWGYDAELLREGTPLSCDRDYFIKDGRPLPIVGMTYMTSDVARKFLFLPNVSVWDKDIAQMVKAGINLLRTGIWSAWRQVMFVDGHPYEEVLRAIDAFFLTCKKHNIEVTFNFFAFTPELWEGVNPYLDPRSVEAQKRFISAIVSRHKETTNVHWDLINEPSMFNPNKPFSGPQSAQDKFEKAAFTAWLENRHGDIRKLQERWNMTPMELPDFQSAKLPDVSEMNMKTTEMLEKKGGPWLDYTYFTMDMHNRWASELIATIRSINPAHLATVGQDEGLGALRPSPFFYAEVVDYTTVHTWWLMDQLVWDGIFSKAPDKPSLIQETGIMYIETADGRAKRSEHELRNILERKYAYAFSTGGAGAVQWIWNINFYMNNINESHIGALRADGTEKPEADVSYDFGAFMGRIRDLFVDRQLEEVVAIFPYSNDFSTRRLAGEATSKLTRTLAYSMNVPFRGMGEYQLDALEHNPPKLIIVPSAHNFSDEALEKLTQHVRTHGGTLLFTGPLGLNEYWTPVSRLTDVVGETVLSNILREEMMVLNGSQYPVSFGGARISQANKEIALSEGEDENNGWSSGHGTTRRYALGKGQLIWCPLPVELNERGESIEALYNYALAEAGVSEEMTWVKGGQLPGVYGRKLSFAQGSLYIFVSEYSVDTAIEVKDPATGRSYAFELESERTVMFATDREGALSAVYRPNQVVVNVK